jgi:hypothetical protein
VSAQVTFRGAIVERARTGDDRHLVGARAPTGSVPEKITGSTGTLARASRPSPGGGWFVGFVWFARPSETNRWKARVAHNRQDPAVESLELLGEQLDRTLAELQAARERVDQLLELRTAGHTWHEIVAAESRPLVVETVTRALDDLGTVGGRFRRDEAVALQRENVSITRIGKLFGVSRQRVSAILQERARQPGEETAEPA